EAARSCSRRPLGNSAAPRRPAMPRSAAGETANAPCAARTAAASAVSSEPARGTTDAHSVNAAASALVGDASMRLTLISLVGPITLYHNHLLTRHDPHHSAPWPPHCRRKASRSTAGSPDG